MFPDKNNIHVARDTWMPSPENWSGGLNIYVNVSSITREIRQEVAFLSALDHPHLTQLCGVRTTPHMCLLLELAPLGSLRNMLKEYQNNNLVLEPLTLKTTTLQVHVHFNFNFNFVIHGIVLYYAYVHMCECEFKGHAIIARKGGEPGNEAIIDVFS